MEPTALVNCGCCASSLTFGRLKFEHGQLRPTASKGKIVYRALSGIIVVWSALAVPSIVRGDTIWVRDDAGNEVPCARDVIAAKGYIPNKGWVDEPTRGYYHVVDGRIQESYCSLPSIRIERSSPIERRALLEQFKAHGSMAEITNKEGKKVIGMLFAFRAPLGYLLQGRTEPTQESMLILIAEGRSEVVPFDRIRSVAINADILTLTLRTSVGIVASLGRPSFTVKGTSSSRSLDLES